jgi:hypothetical protein
MAGLAAAYDVRFNDGVVAWDQFGHFLATRGLYGFFMNYLMLRRKLSPRYPSLLSVEAMRYETKPL